MSAGPSTSPLDQFGSGRSKLLPGGLLSGTGTELFGQSTFSALRGWPVMVKLIRPLDSGERELGGVLGTYENGVFDLWVNETDVISLAKRILCL